MAVIDRCKGLISKSGLCKSFLGNWSMQMSQMTLGVSSSAELDKNGREKISKATEGSPQESTYQVSCKNFS